MLILMREGEKRHMARMTISADRMYLQTIGVKKSTYSGDPSESGQSIEHGSHSDCFNSKEEKE